MRLYNANENSSANGYPSIRNKDLGLGAVRCDEMGPIFTWNGRLMTQDSATDSVIMAGIYVA